MFCRETVGGGDSCGAQGNAHRSPQSAPAPRSRGRIGPQHVDRRWTHWTWTTSFPLSQPSWAQHSLPVVPAGIGRPLRLYRGQTLLQRVLGADCGRQLMVAASAGRELSQAGETGMVGCIVGAVVIDVNGQGPEGRPTDFGIEEHLQLADR